jgi:hypothetical protein
VRDLKQIETFLGLVFGRSAVLESQKDRNRVVSFLLATAIFFCSTCQLSSVIAAETPSRPSQWEATVEAAKKEGKVNIYMYRYGKVLRCLQKRLSGNPTLPFNRHRRADHDEDLG